MFNTMIMLKIFSILAFLILAIMIIIYYSYLLIEPYAASNEFIRKLTSDNAYIPPIQKNILDPTSTIWEAPNMVNFPQFINNLEDITKRRPEWFPNEETFNSSPTYTENYRPGDWRINGYTTAQELERLQKK